MSAEQAADSAVCPMHSSDPMAKAVRVNRHLLGDPPQPCSCVGGGVQWTGCVHCGQKLPHEGTSWQESYRCQLFQRIAEQAWDEAAQALAWALDNGSAESAAAYVASNNPYRTSPTQAQS